MIICVRPFIKLFGFWQWIYSILFFCAFAIRIYLLTLLSHEAGRAVDMQCELQEGGGGGAQASRRPTVTMAVGIGVFSLTLLPPSSPSSGSSASAGRLLVSFEMALRPSSVELHPSSVLLAGFYCVSANLITAALTVVAAQIIGAIVH